jgi:hypothetical protein
VASAAGYSGTPLPKKLGIQAGHVVALHGAPVDYGKTLGELPPGVRVRAGGGARADVVQLFATRRAALAKALVRLGRSIFPDGALWISWPKKTAKGAAALASDVDENAIRALALPLGLVDVKVCAVDETWSGLKLVWRKELRAGPRRKAARS